MPTNTKQQLCIKPTGFLLCSLVNVFSKPNIVWLNLSHCEFPHGLYGEVMVLSTPYILHKASMILLSKLLPWLLCMQAGIPYTWNQCSTRAFATVKACWLLVVTATLNFVKAPVITRTFSIPPLDGSILVKSKQTKSSGLWAIRWPNFGLGVLQSSFATWHHLHWSTHEWASWVTVGQ